MELLVLLIFLKEVLRNLSVTIREIWILELYVPSSLLQPSSKALLGVVINYLYVRIIRKLR